MNQDTPSNLQTAVADHAHRTGTWLRMPCCEADEAHPVQILGVEDGIIEIAAPGEPHTPWQRSERDSTQIILGWSDAGGTIALMCHVVRSDSAKWALRAVSSGDFLQRRKHLRVKTNGVANLMDGQLDRIVTARLSDISEAGMRCTFTDYIPNPGQDVTRWALRIDGSALVVVAKLIWANRSGPIDYVAGFEFLEVHDALASRLRAHIISQLVKHGPLPDSRDPISDF